ncbi:hypothetical protein [Raoultella planticola]|uniref:hypothetical protein n=1 Tax=Raoultella planticola TaxID=575 RepID=UPI0005161A4F|nr:hypothetical protein [Raoultella planticola]
MKLSKYSYIPLTYLLLNVKIGSLGETFPITLATFTILFIAFCVRGISKNKILLSFGLLIFLVLFNKIFGRPLDPSKYFTSLMLFIYVGTVSSLIYSSTFIKLKNNNTLIYAVKRVILIVVAISVLEVLELLILGSSQLISFFSKVLIYSNEYLINFLQYGALRSNSLYFEPAFYSLVLISMWLCLRQLEYRNKLFDIIVFVGVLSSGSFSGLMTFIILFGIEMILVYSERKSLKKKIPYIILSLLVLIIVIYFLLPYILIRLGELGSAGTSSYYRIIGPLKIVSSALTNIDGIIQFGSLYELVSSFGILNGSQVGKTLDNGIYVLIVHFSWLAILAIAVYLFCFMKIFCSEVKINRNGKDKGIVILLLFVPLSLMFTGAIFSPEYIFTIIAPVIARKINKDYGN